MKPAVQELKESRDHLFSRLSAGDDPESFQREYTESIDRYFRVCLQESSTWRSLSRQNTPFAFVGVGGYGRLELCPYSDIDIMILFDKKIPSQAKNIVEEVLYPLWDLGLDIGYGTRTIKDCLILSRNDFEVLTSMMNSRFVCGNSKTYLYLNEELEKKVISKKAIVFGQWLKERDSIRVETFGDATYLLEPNLKEGTGGLRDYHHILWLAGAVFGLKTPRDLEYSGILSHYEYHELTDNVKFIGLVRNQLHLLSGRKNDCLNFEYQEKIANRLGFRDIKGIPAVEQFLGKLHSSMTSIKTLYRSFVVRQLPKKRGPKAAEQTDISKGLYFHNEEINFDSATIILLNPFLLLEVFQQRSIVRRPLSIEARRLVREFLYLVDDAFRASEKATQGFLNIINSKYASDTLDEMFETGFLDRFIPEFAQIRDRVQFDAYHTFPVGRHILETVRFLKNVADQKDILLLDIFSDLKNPEALFLSGLFHDIGKTKGTGHARKGLAITRTILKRFRYEEEASEDILFLVSNHLLLAETATRRDLNDEKVVVQCARTIGDVERLKMLYLLTWADSRATGPGAWNEWIANLVQELFFK
ncbi:MAG: HD domain-containing protein, partial [Thermodesulfobacteriota bacterium]|nr:HD domain-containing protein [Thermodesulfobacteriota bacterium]